LQLSAGINWAKMETGGQVVDFTSCEQGEEMEQRARAKMAEAEIRDSNMAAPPTPRLPAVVKVAGATACLITILYFTYLLRDYIHAVLLWTEQQPPGLVLVIFVALFTLVSLPLAWGYIVVNLACGYLFGFVYGLIVTVITATAGILAAHLIIVRCLASHVRKLLHTSEYSKSLYAVISGPQAFKLIVLTRLTPVPFGLQNAVFSVSNLPCGRYLGASVLGLFPTQCINVYMGSTLRSMEEVLTNEDTVRAGWLLLVAQLAVSAAVALFVVRKARAELERSLQDSGLDSVVVVGEK